jgi:hypothetical protein
MIVWLDLSESDSRLNIAVCEYAFLKTSSDPSSCVNVDVL